MTSQCLLQVFLTLNRAGFYSRSSKIPEKWSGEGRLDSETAKINNFFTKTGRSATVSNYLAGWSSEWVREHGVDGFRCDTAKHVEFASLEKP